MEIQTSIDTEKKTEKNWIAGGKWIIDKGKIISNTV